MPLKRLAEVRACNACRAASHKRIKNGFALFGELQDPVGQQRQRLLRRALSALDVVGPHGMVSAAVAVNPRSPAR